MTAAPLCSLCTQQHRTAGGGHWCGRWGYCDDECGCVPCAEDRSES